MNIGVVFPQTEIGSDRSLLREFLVGVSDAGYAHLILYDHVFGVDTRGLPSWEHPYALEHEFHEPFTTLGFAAGLTSLELMTGVLILPQRQTVLVAKQAAQVDILSGGRLRVGVGIGWNRAEYESLDVPFEVRAERFEEQLELLRRLWTEQSMVFRGRFHDIPPGGIRPLPIQRPIPLWLGGGRGTNPTVLKRIGRVSDGWFPNLFPRGSGAYELKDLVPALQFRLNVIRRAAELAGRDPEVLGLQGIVELGRQATPRRINGDLSIWRDLGATHVALRTMHQGYRGREHLERLTEVAPDLLGFFG